MKLRGKRALVMGLGIHGGGLGVARFLVDQGAAVTVTDMREPEQLRASLDALAGLPIRWVLGEHREDDFRNTDLVIRNPAVPRESRYLQIARAAGAAIEMEMTLFFRLCPGPILGITGTKGKTTTTLLTGAMLREQFPDTVVAGNLRVSALEQLPKIGPNTPVVLELSSFALEGLGEAKLSPQYACITNLSPDHLDRYGTMAAYAEAKAQIFLHQNERDIAVRNYNDGSAHLGERAAGAFVWFLGVDAASHEAFSDLPMPIAYWQHDQLIWRHSLDQYEGICSAEDVQLTGEHNRANIAAAAALAKSFGVETRHIRNAIHNFTGVEHRLEFVRELDGVRYINDTAATAPDAAIAALRSFTQPIVLIAGGADKNLPFDAFAREIAQRVKAVVLLQGTATAKLLQALNDEGRRTKDERRPTTDDRRPTTHNELSFVNGPFDDFAYAIRTARELAEPGDIVLLSPGCASFGMFRNEFHRGEEFRRIVKEL
jgi:UDP-N-acetylmuramoylalanine--D-glutamate ligase